MNEAAALSLTDGSVVHSAQAVLRPPPTPTRHQPTSRPSPVIGPVAPTTPLRRPHPSRLDALVEPTHRPALAVRGRAAVADQVDACHPSLLSVARACCSASPNGSRSRRLRSTNSPSNTRSHSFRQPAQPTTRSEEPGHTPNRARRWISAGRAHAHTRLTPADRRRPGRSTRATARCGYPDSGELGAGSAPPPRGWSRARTRSPGSDRPPGGVRLGARARS
jgi:hypothetical protein